MMGEVFGVMPEYVRGSKCGTKGTYGAIHPSAALIRVTYLQNAKKSSKTVHSGYGFFMPRTPKRGGAVIEPRSYADNTKKFGNTSTRLRSGELQSPQHGAAELQHALSNTIREHLLDNDTTMKAFCDQRDLPEGLSYERLYRISNGTTMMGLTDVMFWTALIPTFGVTLTTMIHNLALEMTLDGSTTSS